MLPLEYQSSTQKERKEVVKQIADGFSSIDKNRFPKISLTIESGNNKKNELLHLVIEQMYSNNFDLESSFEAVEENI